MNIGRGGIVVATFPTLAFYYIRLNEQPYYTIFHVLLLRVSLQ
jgi:hypothetical protein